MLRFRSAGRSHRGLVREHNEDSGFAGPYLQLVADGVGGAAAGEVASATAAYVTSAFTMAQGDGADLRDVLAEAVRLAHAQLRAGVAADPAREGMGTTLTAVLTDGDTVALAHLGDSRAYLWREDSLALVSRDQTLVQLLLDEGRITAEEARDHPRRNVVLQALDAAQPAEPDLHLLDLEAGDRLLLCSDGLTDMVDEATLVGALTLADRERAADALVQAALDAGGRDNVTVLVADLEDGPALCRDGALLGALADPRLVLDPAAVRS